MIPDIPFNDLPPLPPKNLIETPQILKIAIEAHKELALLKGAGPLIPNQAVLIQTIALQEAKLSSEIENIMTTNDELYKALSDEDERADPNTKEVLRYNEALWYGYEALKKNKRLLNTVLFEELANIITEKSFGVRKLPGTQLKNPLTNQIIYTPPVGETVIRNKLANLEKFIYENKDIDSLVKLGIIHYQFEAVHPFYDGNGRTGRIINTLYLINEGLLEIPVLYLSKYIIENKAAYYSGLNRVTTQEDWESWIIYILNGIIITAKMTREKILAIKKLIEKTIDEVRDKLPKIYSRDLVELIFHYPYCKIHFIEKAGLARRQTASSYLHQLEEIGLLRSFKKGKEKYYINKRFFDLLTQ